MDVDTIELLTARMNEAFINAEQSLKNALALQVKAGLEVDPFNVTKQMRFKELQALSARLSGEIMKGSPTAIQALMRDVRRLAHDSVSGVLSREESTALARLQDGATPALNNALSSAPAAVAMNTELADVHRLASNAILRFPNDIYREAIRMEATQVLLGTATGAVAQQRAWQRLVAGAAPRIVDKAGRKWNTATYVEMATRTATHRAWDQQHELTMADTGLDFVSIVVGNGACKACSEWSGKILRRDAGPTGRIPVPDLSSEDPDATITINVEGTLDDARRHGWRHPNCRCRPVAYVPGVSEVEKGTTYDPEMEAARAKQREIERKIRKAKEDANNALSPEERAKAQARVRKHQKEMREHLSQYDGKDGRPRLNRKSRREQVDLGNKIPEVKVVSDTGVKSPFKPHTSALDGYSVRADVDKALGEPLKNNMKDRTLRSHLHDYTEGRTNAGYLRSGGGMYQSDIDRVHELDAVMRPTTEPLDLTRTLGMGKDEFIATFGPDGSTDLSWLPGSALQDKAFMSVSYGNPGGQAPIIEWKQGIRLRIHAPKGTKMADLSEISDFKDQNELVLARNTRLRVLSSEVDDQGRPVINAIVEAQEDPPDIPVWE